MKSIRITFRLTPYQLAYALQTARQLEPTYKLISINDLVKTVYISCLDKMSITKPDEFPVSILEEILAFSDKSAENKLTLEDLLSIEKLSSKD